jgi:AcrR family transcriptional regulator
MSYRRTDHVVRQLADRHRAIIAAAQALATESGMGTVQIAPVAERAGIAAGTVYRYFPATIAEREIAAMRHAADAAPGPLSALAAAITTFGARAIRNRRLSWAVLAEPVDPEVDAVQLNYRRALASELEARIRKALDDSRLPPQDTALASAAFLGILLEALFGPAAPASGHSTAKSRETVQVLTLLCLRALGVADARARGLVVQSIWPSNEAE